MTEQRDEEQDIHDVSELIILAPDGKSLVFPVTAVHGPVTVADVLTFVESRTAVPSAMMQLRKGCIGSVLLHDEGTVPLEQEFFEARLCGGLAGGKGGFGAMLRALAKQNTGHKTVDFGACRDLNGRRLRHVNNDIKLQKWTEARERKEEAKRRGIQLDSDDEEQITASESGIKGWHLSVPSWIDHVKQKETKSVRRKAASKRRWQDEEADVLDSGLATRSLRGVVTMMDQLRGSFVIVDGDVYVPFTANAEEPASDWSNVLKVGDLMEVVAVAKTQGRNKWYGFKATRVAPDDHTPGSSATLISQSSSVSTSVSKKIKLSGENQSKRGPSLVTPKVSPFVDHDQADEDAASSMAAAVSMGLAQAKKKKKNNANERNNEKLAMIPVDLDSHTRRAGYHGVHSVGANATAGWLGLLAGELQFESNGVVRGVSDFASVCALGVALTQGKWYYEVELLTGGVMQVGWADQFFKGDSENGDGVGDDQHSWAYDGCRQQKWNGEAPEDYGAAWSAGDVVGCLLDLESVNDKEGVDAEDRALCGKVSFTLNGQDLSSAFKISLPTSSSSSHSSSLITPTSQQLLSTTSTPSFYPAAAIEDGEVLAVHVTTASLRYAPPEGFRAVAEAMAIRPPEPKPIAQQRPEVQVACDNHENKSQIGAPVTSITGETKATSPNTGHKAASEKEKLPLEPQELDLAAYASQNDLEKLGLDRLKAALMFLGLKCGGTLEQRAERLFSIKGVPKDKIDPKLLAMSGSVKKRRDRKRDSESR